MVYSIVGIIAIAVTFIVNIDIFINLKKKKAFPGEKQYLFFLLSVIAFHVTDAFWGILYDNHSAIAVTIDTNIYFIAMASSILLWGLFVRFYLGRKNKTIAYLSAGVFILQMIAIIVNFFYPILFKLTDECVYSALPMRYVMLGVQMFMYFVLAAYSLYASFKQRDSARRHYFAVCSFSGLMLIAIALQVFFPLLPMYSFGYLFGICALHSFVVADEKANQRDELEEAKRQIATDPLTGVMSKHAYVDKEASIDERIDKKIMEPFAVVIFDLNELKIINETKGYDVGNKYIIKSVEMIKETFRDNRIYRVSGDQFTIFLTGKDYENRNISLNVFNKKIDENLMRGNMDVVAAGLAIFIPEKDTSVIHTYTRANREMLVRKHALKEKKMNIDI